MSSSDKRQKTTTSKKKEERRLAILPASYWASLGFDKHAVKVMETFQQKLLDGDPCVTLKDFGIIRGPFVPYHDAIMPYWEAYAKNHDKIPTTKFSASNVDIPAPVWETITPRLSTIKEISLEECRLDAAAICGFSRFLSSNETLTELSLTCNGITDLHAARSLSLAMKSHPALQKFNAVYCEFGGMYRLNRPQPEIARAIIDGCENLLEVHINRCGMDDSCAAAYAAMIKRNKNIRILSVFWEYFTRVGEDKITEAVYDTSSLDAIVDSNHKCSISISDRNDDPNFNIANKMAYVNSSEYPDALKIRYKVQRALFGVGREPEIEGYGHGKVIKAEEGKVMDLAYFGDVSLKLMPLVLEFMIKLRLVMAHEFEPEGYYIKRSWFGFYDEEGKEHLNRMYQVFKGLCVPLLFG